MGASSKSAVVEKAAVEAIEQVVEQVIHNIVSEEKATEVVKPVVKETPQQKLVRIFTGWEKSDSVDAAAELLGMDKDDLTSYVAQHRSDKFKMVQERDEKGNLVYKKNEDGTTKLDKKTNKPVVSMVKAKDAKGEFIVEKRGFPFKQMPRGRKTSDNYEETLALLAAAVGIKEEDLASR